MGDATAGDDGELMIKLHEAGHAFRVLYVEDDHDIRTRCLALLTRIFDKIDVAVDAQEAIAAYREEHYDLVITDIMMPGMNGIDLIEAVKKLNPFQRILIVTGFGDAGYLYEAIKLGVDGYLIKPFDLQQMLATFHKIIASLVMTAQNRDYKERLHALVEQKTQEVIDAYTFDEITGLYNLSQFNKDLAQRGEVTAAVIKVLNFKKINNCFGYEIGNDLLIQFARFLKKTTADYRGGDGGFFRVYRLGGARFALMCDAAVALALHYIQTVVHGAETYDFFIDMQPMAVDIACGSASGIGAVLLSQAEMALDHAIAGKRTHEVYTQGLPLVLQYRQHLVWIQQIRSALADGRIVNHYQPIFNNRSGHIEKYEALVRLMMPDGTLVTPGFFLPIAKKTKLYAEITQCVFARALEDFASLPYEVSVNISVDDIKNETTAARIFSLLEAYSSPEKVIFELLESEGIDEFETVRRFCERVKQYGCKIALDDFGTGYSNFSHLIKLDVDMIKIDGSLISSVVDSVESEVIVNAIVNFSAKLGLRTVAEYVASDAIKTKVASLGIEELQGYYVGMPGVCPAT